MLVTYRPGPPLATHVDTFWYYDGSPAACHKERVLPNGRFQIMLDLSSGRGLVCGVRTRHSIIDTAAIHPLVGVVFHPGGARGFFDAPGNAFYNLAVPLDSTWTGSTGQLQDQLHEAGSAEEKFRVLESALLDAMRYAGEGRLRLHSSVQYALGEFRRAPHIRSVVEIARAAGFSRRRFSQVFSEQVGITPKLYCRLHRFLEIVQKISSGGPVDWADVALVGGYCDQAHLAHEFQDFSGLSPARYLAAERPHLYHVRID